jgi:hypothetical protein
LLFSFYYRSMLAPALLAEARMGALNMHGSLLPRYRGRAPVNWAVLSGERETGATLHYMAEKPDAGDIVAQMRVPILPDDTAREVFDKVTVAAEIALDGALPALLAGTAPGARRISRPAVFRRPPAGRRRHRLEAGDARRFTTWCARSPRPIPARARCSRAGPHACCARESSIRPRLPPRHLRSNPAPASSSPAAAAAARLRCSRSRSGQALRSAGFLEQFGAAPVPLESPPGMPSAHV